MGTKFTELVLPQELTAVAEDNTLQIEVASWECREPAGGYNPNEAGTYLFTPVLPQTYIIAENLQLPVITVVLESITEKVTEQTTDTERNETEDSAKAEPITESEDDTETESDTETELQTEVEEIRSQKKAADAVRTRRNRNNSDASRTFGLSNEKIIIEKDGQDIAVSLGENTPVTVPANQEIILTGTWNGNISGDQHVVTVRGGVEANITLRDLSIDVSGTDQAGAFTITGNSSVNLTVENGNLLSSGYKRAGLHISNDSALLVTEESTGAVEIYGGGHGAGIGGNGDGAGGRITINGGKLIAYGGLYNASNGPASGAGIGSGSFSSDDYQITVNGGEIIATAGLGAAGIGGGASAEGGEIQITGGKITTSSFSAAGMGNGINFNDFKATIAISGGTITAISSFETAIDAGQTGKIQITGGSIATNASQSTVPKPVNEVDIPVYLNTLTLGDPAVAKGTAVTECAVTDLAYEYGLKDVETGEDGKVYFWLPQDNSETARVAVTAAAQTYLAQWARTGAAEENTLYLPGNITYYDHEGEPLAVLPTEYDQVKSNICGARVSIPQIKPYDRTGYERFSGWFTEPDGGEQITEIDRESVQNYQLYARFEDITAPTGVIQIRDKQYSDFRDPAAVTLFTKRDAAVSVTGADSGSGIAAVQYLLSKTPLSLSAAEAAAGWIDYQNELTITPGTKCFVYARITDRAGNSACLGSDGMVVYRDSQAVTERIRYTKTSITDVTAEVTLHGNTVNEVRNGAVTLNENTDYSVDPANDTLTFHASYLNSLTAGAYTLEITYHPLGVEFADTAGNDAPAETALALTVEKAKQQFTGLPDLVKVSGDEAFTVTPGTNAAAEQPVFTYQSNDTTVIGIDARNNFVIRGPGTAEITVNASETASYMAAAESFTIRVLPDSAALNEVIAAVSDLLEGLAPTQIGTGDGQYPETAVQELQTALAAAQRIAAQLEQYSQLEVDAARDALLAALERFQNSRVQHHAYRFSTPSPATPEAVR